MIHDPYQYFKKKLPSPKTKVPQNVINVIKELGENSVIFFLFLLTRKTKWRVYRNLNEVGCDIILSNSGGLIKVEVKTRQSVHSTSKNFAKMGHRRVQFELTALEHKSCDVIVGFWFDRNAYFILTKNQLVPSTSAKKKYRILIDEKIDAQGNVTYFYGKKGQRKQLIPNNWNTLDKMMAN